MQLTHSTVRQWRASMHWHGRSARARIREEVFADELGLQLVRIRTDATLIRLPPFLPDLDEDLQPRNDGAPPLLEVADIKRAIRHLREAGLEVGPMVEEDWEATAELTVPNVGSFRLVGPWLRGWPQ